MEVASLWDRLASLEDHESLRTAYGKVTYHNSGADAGWVVEWKGQKELAHTATHVIGMLEQRQEERRAVSKVSWKRRRQR